MLQSQLLEILQHYQVKHSLFAQLVLDTYAGFWADCVVYSPTEQLVPVSAIITGTADLDTVRQVIRDYFAELEPVQIYQAAILTSRIVAIAGVTDVVLSPSSNVVPTVDPFHTNGCDSVL
jgi:hypothetical protein